MAEGPVKGVPPEVRWLVDALAWVCLIRWQRNKAENDRIWGPDNWVTCFGCPDDFGFPSYHHRNAHA